MSPRDSELVLDASVCINLVATDKLGPIVRALGVPILVVEQVAREVMRHPFDAASAQSPLTRFAEDGTLRVVALTDASAETWLSLVGAPPPDDLDDGEAATMAFAHDRSACPVIDERKGIRVCSSRFPSLKHLSTLDLLRDPAVHRVLGRDGLADAVWSALRYARMRVSSAHEEWVREVVGPERLAECHSLRLAARAPLSSSGSTRPRRTSRGG